MLEKHTDTTYPIDQLFLKRWSGIAFDPNRPLEDSVIKQMIEAARWAPSCFNEQPFRFIVASKVNHPKQWQAMFDTLMELNQKWCKAVPVLIAVCTKEKFSHNQQCNPAAAYDAGAAAISACLQASQQGVMTHQMAGFSEDKLRESFQVPEGYQIISVIAAGYQLPENNIPEAFKQKEFAPRMRKPLESICAFGDPSNIW